MFGLDATTGEIAWETQIFDYQVTPAGHSSGPIIADGKAISGRSCRPAGGPDSCVILAHDARTGAELWRRHTIPKPGEPGDETWGGVPWEERLHVGTWMPASYDSELRLIYQGTSVTSPAPKFMLGGIENKHLYHNSTLALDIDTGEIRWYYQHLNDHWDLDHPFERILVDTAVAPDPSEVSWINPRLEPGEVRKVMTGDALDERTIEQLVLGVSTRGYAASLEPLPSRVRGRGASKSAASRRVVSGTRARMREDLERALDGLDLVALYLDGLTIAERTVIVALGLTTDGTKVPLGLWQGSTENTTVCTELLQHLLDRGLLIQGKLLCVIDGGKGLRRALLNVLGDAVLVQRCQVHTRRNLHDHLPASRYSYVRRALREAYQSKTFTVAKARLQALAAWLERQGEHGAAASLREGLDETLTVLKLTLPATLRRSLATTNPVETLIGTIRRVSRNVTRWRGDMVPRWTALGLRTAEQKFRRIKGYRDLPVLVRELRRDAPSLDANAEAA